MAKRSQSRDVRAFGYAARPRRSRLQDGVQESYWTVRCRNQDDPGEWSLGWFPGIRQAEQAFFGWLDARRKTPVPKGGTALMTAVIDQYVEMVPSMGKRPKTRENRVFRVKKLRSFIESMNAEMTVREFDDDVFEKYLVWLRDEMQHKPQTIENLLIGTRTLLRWAVGKGLVADAPKVPGFRVPAPQHDVLYAEDVEATIAHAPAPLNIMLRLLWETGLRVSEAATTRGCDLLLADNLVVIQERGAFVPKTPDSERKVPVTDALMTDLRALVTAPDAPLFPCKVRCVYHYWRNLLTKAQKAAGVETFTFHALRRAVSDRLRNGGVPVDRYAKVMGHAAITAVRHYSTVAPGDFHADLAAGLGAVRRRTARSESR